MEATTIRHVDCHMLLPPDSLSLRCAKCIQHRASLLIQTKRIQDAERTALSSHTNYRYLSRPELIDRLAVEHHHCRLLSKKCERLQAKVADVSEIVGVSLDPNVHEGLKEVMISQNGSILQ